MFVIIPKNLETHLAISIEGGHKIKLNFFSQLILSNSGINPLNRIRKHCRFSLKVLQKRMKCISSSIDSSSQYLHILSQTGVTGRVYRPDSILRELFYIPKYLYSELLRKYAELRPSRTEMPFVTSKFLCSEDLMFRRAYVPTVTVELLIHQILNY